MYTLYLLVSHRIRVLFALLDVLLDDLDVQVAFDTQKDGDGDGFFNKRD